MPNYNAAKSLHAVLFSDKLTERFTESINVHPDNNPWTFDNLLVNGAPVYASSSEKAKTQIVADMWRNTGFFNNLTNIGTADQVATLSAVAHYSDVPNCRVMVD